MPSTLMHSYNEYASSPHPGTRGVQKVLGPTMKEQRYDIDFIYQKALFLHIITVKTNALLAPLR